MKKREKLKKVAVCLAIIAVLVTCFLSYKIGYNAGYGQAKFDNIANRVAHKEMIFQNGIISGVQSE